MLLIISPLAVGEAHVLGTYLLFTAEVITPIIASHNGLLVGLKSQLEVLSKAHGPPCKDMA